MSYEAFAPVDCDGHVIESLDDMKPFMDEVVTHQASRPALRHHNVFPNLDGAHFAIRRDPKFRANRQNASDGMAGSPSDWAAFLDKAKVKTFRIVSIRRPGHRNAQLPRLRRPFVPLL